MTNNPTGTPSEQEGDSPVNDQRLLQEAMVEEFAKETRRNWREAHTHPQDRFKGLRYEVADAAITLVAAGLLKPSDDIVFEACDMTDEERQSVRFLGHHAPSLNPSEIEIEEDVETTIIRTGLDTPVRIITGMKEFRNYPRFLQPNITETEENKENTMNKNTENEKIEFDVEEVEGVEYIKEEEDPRGRAKKVHLWDGKKYITYEDGTTEDENGHIVHGVFPWEKPQEIGKANITLEPAEKPQEIGKANITLEPAEKPQEIGKANITLEPAEKPQEIGKANITLEPAEKPQEIGKANITLEPAEKPQEIGKANITLEPAEKEGRDTMQNILTQGTTFIHWTTPKMGNNHIGIEWASPYKAHDNFPTEEDEEEETAYNNPPLVDDALSLAIEARIDRLFNDRHTMLAEDVLDKIERLRDMKTMD